MADNLTTTTTVATPPSGTVVAARVVTYSGDSAYIAPVGLVAFSGSDDAKSAADIPGDATNGLDVDVTRLSALVAGTAIIGKVGIDQTTPGTTNAVQANAGTNLNTSALALEAGGNLAATATSLAIMDDWDETDRAKVNIVVGQAGVTAGAGAVAANTPRVTLASDDPAVASLAVIDNIVSGSGVNISQINGVTPLMGAGNTGTGSPRVTIASDQATIPVSVPAIAVSAAVTSVNDSNSSQTLLNSNSSRKGFKLFNDSTQVAYVKEGTTATTTDYSYQIQPKGYYEQTGVSPYTGRIDCIWAADASGAMKITELS